MSNHRMDDVVDFLNASDSTERLFKHRVFEDHSKLLGKFFKNVVAKDADEINRAYVAAGKVAPYKSGTKIYEFDIPMGDGFVLFQAQGCEWELLEGLKNTHSVWDFRLKQGQVVEYSLRCLVRI